MEPQFHSKMITEKGNQIKLQIWEANAESLSKDIFRETDAFIVVYDACSMESFRAVNGYFREIEDYQANL